MRTHDPTWATDEPCPNGCDGELTLPDTDTAVLRAECRICGHAEIWETSQTQWAGDR